MLRLCPMELHPFNHNYQPLEANNSLHTDLNILSGLTDQAQLHYYLSEGPLFDPHLIQHSDLHTSPSIFPESQILHSSQPYDAVHQSVDSCQQFPSFSHDHMMADFHSQADPYHQRIGSAEITPSSPANIMENAEVKFKDPGDHEQTGTIMKIYQDDTYKIQTSNDTYDHVAYHNILKYGSK